MAELWNAFLEDYAEEVFDWSLRLTLETFFHYCQDGNRGVANFQKQKIGRANDFTIQQPVEGRQAKVTEECPACRMWKDSENVWHPPEDPAII